MRVAVDVCDLCDTDVFLRHPGEARIGSPRFPGPEEFRVIQGITHSDSWTFRGGFLGFKKGMIEERKDGYSPEIDGARAGNCGQAEGARVRHGGAGAGRHFAPGAGADYPYAVLQPELRLLQ